MNTTASTTPSIASKRKLILPPTRRSKSSRCAAPSSKITSTTWSATPRPPAPPATAPESPARRLRHQAGRRTAQRAWPVTGAREDPKAFGEVRRITAHPYAKIARLDIGCLNPAGWRVYSPSPATLHFFVPWLGAVVREDHALCVKFTRRGQHAKQNSVDFGAFWRWHCRCSRSG